MVLSEQEVALPGAEPQGGQGLAAGSELSVGHVGLGVDQLHQAPLPPRSQDAAGPRRRSVVPGHLHRGPAQAEEFLHTHTHTVMEAMPFVAPPPLLGM